MKTEREIKEELDALMEMQPRTEEVMLQIDMLLWVLNDRSGLPPINLREENADDTYTTT